MRKLAKIVKILRKVNCDKLSRFKKNGKKMTNEEKKMRKMTNLVKKWHKGQKFLGKIEKIDRLRPKLITYDDCDMTIMKKSSSQQI